MDDSDKQKEKLKAVINIGISMQLISTVIAFAAKNNKTDFLEKLNELIKSFVEGLSDEEKKKLQEDINLMLESKAGEFANELGKKLDPQQKNEAVKTLQSLYKQGQP
jgi:DNA-binding MarR family transcriptional regulator